MNILSGAIHPDSGYLEIEGEKYFKLNPQDSIALGIDIIHQEIALVDTLSVMENMSLGNLGNRYGFVKSRNIIKKEVERVFSMLNVKLDPLELVENLTTSMKQIVEIGKTLIKNPRILLMDEPTSSLDVLTQKYFMNLIRDLHEKMGITMLYITHDLATIAEVTDRVAIMYLGKIVEIGDREELFSNPLHPYAQALLSAIPVPNPERKRKKTELKGEIPSAIDIPPGCRFHPRCPKAFDKCPVDEPSLASVGEHHTVECHLY